MSGTDDQCSHTDSGVTVDSTGCDLDSDGDGVRDSDDQCLQTDSGVTVDSTGCDLDSDGDGVRTVMINVRKQTQE